MRRIASTCLFAAFVLAAIPASGHAAFAYPAAGPVVGHAPPVYRIGASGQAKLQRLLRPHAYYGDVITGDVRAATGDPDIVVIDRRWRIGEIYSCNYMFLRGGQRGRALLCE